MEDAGIYALESGFLDRFVRIGIAQERILSVDFPTRIDDDVAREHELLDRVDTYLQGERDEFRDVSVAMTMPTEKRDVLEKVREVPYGESATVDQITRMVPGRDPDEESDRTAVREGLAANPAPIFIPTHRVRDGPSGMPADVEAKFRSLEGL